MLEKPKDLPDEQVVEWLQIAFGLPVEHLTFLPLGADSRTIVYQAQTSRHTYFVKVRRGAFDAVVVEFPRWLETQGIKNIISPLLTTNGQTWVTFVDDSVMVYPFVEGQNGYAAPLSVEQWHTLGTTVKHIHTAILPPTLLQAIPYETYDPNWRTILRTFLQGRSDIVDDPMAHQLKTWLTIHHRMLIRLVERAEALALQLQAAASPFVVCHADLHAGNVLIDRYQNLLIVDWDTLMLAPKERDLMFIGGGQGFGGETPEQEEALFYAGYGPAQINWQAIAYYRYERIIQDLAIYCEELLLTTAGGADRAQSLRYAMSNVEPNGTIAMADRAEQKLSQTKEKALPK